MAAVDKCRKSVRLIPVQNGPPAKRPKMQMNPVFRLDTSQLMELVKCIHFVDKSLFIKAFFDTSHMILITAPSRIGKSSNMNTLKTFLEIVVDENANPIYSTMNKSCEFVEKADHQLTANYKLFKDNKLNIYVKEHNFFKEHCGRYPVIYINFKALFGPTYKNVLAQMNQVLYYTFCEHQYLLRSERLNNEEKTLFAYYFNKLEYGKLNEVKLQGAAKILSRLLYIHFKNKKVIILIDEYDNPIAQALFTKGAPLAKIISFIGALISNLLKDNDFVDRALINACVRLAGILSGHANNIVHLQFLGNHKLSAFYGFTAREVKSLFKRVGMPEKFNEAKDWYNGYMSSSQNIKMYNGWSIIKFLLEKVARKHWIETVDMACLQNVFLLEPIRKRIFEMLQGNPIKIKKIDKIQITHIQHLQHLLNAPLPSTVNNNTVDLFLQFMSDCGYFNMSDTNSYRLLNIPNKEIGEELAQKLYTVSFFIKNHNFNGDRISAFTEALENLHPENKQSFRILARCVCELFSEMEYPSNEEELRAPLITFASDSPHFETHAELYVRRNRHFRLDILIIRNDGVAIIFEIKCFRASSIEALNQILKNKYYRILKKQEYKQRVKHRIFIGLHMNKNKSVSLSYLTNSKKINNRRHVFYAHSK